MVQINIAILNPMITIIMRLKVSSVKSSNEMKKLPDWMKESMT